MTTLQAKHYGAIRAARAVVHGPYPWNDHTRERYTREELIAKHGVAIARGLLDAIDELEKLK